MASPVKIPASISNASREELEKLLVATLQKLKARDKKIEEIVKSSEDQSNRASQPEGTAPELQALQDTITSLQNKLLSKEQAFNERLSAETELLNGQIADIQKNLDMEQSNSAALQEQLVQRESFISHLEHAIRKQATELEEMKSNSEKAFAQWQEEREALLEEKKKALEDLSERYKQEESIVLERSLEEERKKAIDNTNTVLPEEQEETTVNILSIHTTTPTPSPMKDPLLSSPSLDQIQTPQPSADKDEMVARSEFDKLAKELTDTKRKFIAATKKRQQEFAAQIHQLESQLADAKCSAEEAAKKVMESEKNDHRGDGGGKEDKKEGIDELEKAAESARAEVVQIRKEVEIERSRFKKALTESKRRIEKLQQDKTTADEALEQLASSTAIQIESLQAQINVADECRKTAEEATHAALLELAEYKTRAHALLKAKESEIKTMHDAASEKYADALDAAETAAVSAEAAAKRAQQELDHFKRTSAEDLAAKEHAHAAALADLRKELETASDAAAAATRQYDQLKLRYESLELRVSQLQEQAHVAAQHASEADSLRRQLSAVRDEYNETVQRLSSDVATKQQERETLHETVTTLREELTALHGTIAALKAAKSPVVTTTASPGMSMPSVFATMSSRGSADSNSDTTKGDTVRDAAITSAIGKEDSLVERFSSDISFGYSRQQQSGSVDLSSILQGKEDSTASAGFSFDGAFGSAGSAGLGTATGDDLDASGAFARLAQREKELSMADKAIRELEKEIRDLERELELHSTQESALKEAVRELERELQRVKVAGQQVDMEYFKNVMLKLFETGQEESLLPVVATVMHFSPTEMDRCKVAMEGRKAKYAAAAAQTAKDSASSVTSYLTSLWG